MIGIVIVAHGGLAREYLSAVEHVVGRQKGMRAVAIEEDHDRAEKQADGTWKRTDGCGYRVFPTIAGKTLTDAQVRKVLGGQAVLVKGFTSKSGKKFDARLVADKERGVAFDFGK